MHKRLRHSNQARFEAKVQEGPVPVHAPALGPCLEWTASQSGGRHGARYGWFLWRDSDLTYGISAHRAAWLIYVGPVPDGTCVLHRCDNRLCVRLTHLFLGSKQDNTLDMFEKGRSPTRGETHHLARTTAAQVAELRARWAAGGITQKALGTEYGLPQASVSRIVRRLAWK